MDTVRINNPIESGFSRVPNSLWSLPVSIDAKAIFAFLLSFRDGATVRVALIEKALRIGRDKRRKAMSELEALGLITRLKSRDASGRVVTNEMIVDTLPLLRELISSLENQGPENQAVGNQGPEKPAVGFSGPTGVESRPKRGGKSGPLYKTKTKKGPAALNLDSQLEKLTAFQRSSLLSGKPFLIGGALVAPSSPEASKLLAALKSCEGA